MVAFTCVDKPKVGHGAAGSPNPVAYNTPYLYCFIFYVFVQAPEPMS